MVGNLSYVGGGSHLYYNIGEILGSHGLKTMVRRKGLTIGFPNLFMWLDDCLHRRSVGGEGCGMGAFYL